MSVMLKHIYVIQGYDSKCIDNKIVVQEFCDLVPTQDLVLRFLQRHAQLSHAKIQKIYVNDVPALIKRKILIVAKALWISWNYLMNYAEKVNKDSIIDIDEHTVTSETNIYIASGEDENKIRGYRFDEAWIHQDVSYGFVQQVIIPTLPSEEAVRIFSVK
jgi:hypothetical protein